MYAKCQVGGEHQAGQSTTTLSVTLNPFVQPRSAVVITLRQLHLNVSATSTRVIDGPWRFELPSALRPSVPQPTPDSSGLYANLSVPQAQQLVSFPIIEPTPLPAFLYPQLFNAKVAAHDSSEPNWLQLTYTAKNEATNAIIVEETTAPPPVYIGSPSSETSITLDGVDVTKRGVSQRPGSAISYTWQRAGIAFTLGAHLSQQVTEPLLEQMVGSMIKPPGNDLTPASGAASSSGTIIFTSSRNGNDDIYAINPDGTGLRQLTNDPDMDFDATWSPDGTKIAFMRMKAIPEIAIPPDALPPISIYVMNADGSDQRNLTPDGSRSFRNLIWSPDGKQLAVECAQKVTDRYGNGQICVFNADGSGMHRVVPTELYDQSPIWSPDGRWIAFWGRAASMDQPTGGIYLVSPDGSQQRTVLNGIEASGSFVWSPDSHEIAYVSEPHTLTIIAIDGSFRQNLDTGDRAPSNPVWSPGRSKILFEWQAPGHSFSGLAVIDADGSNLHDLAPTNDDVISAIWSPDGQEIALVRSIPNHSLATPGVVNQRAELDLIRLDGSPSQTLVDDTLDAEGHGLLDSPPSWQPRPPVPGS